MTTRNCIAILIFHFRLQLKKLIFIFINKFSHFLACKLSNFILHQFGDLHKLWDAPEEFYSYKNGALVFYSKAPLLFIYLNL